MTTTFDKLHKAESELAAAIRELRDLVDAEMKARHDRGPVVRDVIAARVLAANPSLHARIERLAASDELHKARPVELGERTAVRKSFEAEVEAEAHELVAIGKAASIEAARAEAWKSDPERMRAYHFPGVEQIGTAAVAQVSWRVAADTALLEVAKTLGGGDFILGHRLAQQHFPKLAAATRGMPTCD